MKSQIFFKPIGFEFKKCLMKKIFFFALQESIEKTQPGRMDDNVADSDKSARFEWDWTVLCGPQGSIVPLDPETHELHVCFQQLCLQVIYK